ncbi:MAG TPA: hypothetical protein VFQ72_00535 [Candidatus Paceibacterota bacterium]|nr:hypothetical protein [Candidatus Paceibacterota bacterium]
MKWKKFCELQAQYPFLAHDLNWRGVLRDTKEFVRTKVGFIAFRPFEKLDLSASSSSRGTPLKSDYVHVKMECYTAVEYQLSFHVEGEGDGTRMRYVTTDIGDGSIQAHIDDVTRWFEGCEVFRGKQLVWERVVKRTVSGSSYAGLTDMSLEIYPFPRFYRFKPMPRTPLPPSDHSHVAYVTGAPMPPIIPGTLSFAG